MRLARVPRVLAVLCSAVLIAACEPGEASVASAPPPTDEELGENAPVTDEAEDEVEVEEPTALAPTRVLSTNDVARLETVQGITLQWIGWEQRGQVNIRIDDDGIWWLTGEQKSHGSAGLKVEGHITEIGEDYFLLDGQITIIGAPDGNRMCDANKLWRFAVTQGRKYYRLREFEWCDGLTDYVDIYF